MICCGPGCRKESPVTTVADHYNSQYFQWQIKHGKERANQGNWDVFFKTSPNDTIADLGAGGGFVLSTLKVRSKIAVEVNDAARKYINQNSPEIKTFKYPENVPDGIVDILYSIDVIEHMECPITELREMYRTMKRNGRIIVGVKNEGVSFAQPYGPNDINQHLYTWAPLQLFNLITSAGFKVLKVDPPVEEMLRIFKTWDESRNFKSYNTYFYLWAYGVKE